MNVCSIFPNIFEPFVLHVLLCAGGSSGNLFSDVNVSIGCTVYVCSQD